jgi:uncharacterized protein (DUF2235 family)
VGFVRNCGILRSEHADRVNEAYMLYCRRGSRTHPSGIEAELFRRSYSHETPIRFIGVWDTLGTCGILLSGLCLINLLNRRWQFHNTREWGTADTRASVVHRGPQGRRRVQPRFRAVRHRAALDGGSSAQPRLGIRG